MTAISNKTVILWRGLDTNYRMKPKEYFMKKTQFFKCCMIYIFLNCSKTNKKNQLLINKLLFLEAVQFYSQIKVKLILYCIYFHEYFKNIIIIVSSKL